MPELKEEEVRANENTPVPTRAQITKALCRAAIEGPIGFAGHIVETTIEAKRGSN